MAVATRGATATGSAVPALLVALLVACAAAMAAVAGGASVCDLVECGMGTCEEVPGPIPFPGAPNVTFKCDCDPGWSQISPGLQFLPCNIPKCPSGASCFNITMAPPIINLDGACDNINNICGPDGKCVPGKSIFDIRCQCNPGAANLLNNTAFPCVRNCVIGKDGCPVAPPPSPPPPPPPSSPAPPPASNDPPGPAAPAPSGTKGSVSPLQDVLLLLALLAAVQIM